MKLSLSGRILQGGAPEMSTADFVRLAKDTGFDLVELRPNQVPVDSTDTDLTSLRRVLDETGIGVSMIVIGADDFINFIDPFHPDMTVTELATNTAAYARQCLCPE